jgi:hypothetical protein
MSATVFLDVIMVTLLLVGVGLAGFLLWLRKKDKELFEYIEYLELEKEELTGQINCLKHEVDNQRRRFNATVHFMRNE